MKPRFKGMLLIFAIFLLALSMMFLTFGTQSQVGEKIRPAADFVATDQNGHNFSLSDFRGRIVVLHVTQLENPLCLECESSIVDELREIKNLADGGDPGIVVVTLNLRKAFGPEPGWQWHRKTMGSMLLGDGSRNPIRTLSERTIWSTGKLTGLFQTRRCSSLTDNRTLPQSIMSMWSGEALRMESRARSDRVGIGDDHIWTLGDRMLDATSQTDLGMTSIIGLGIITSFSPCSLALLFTMMMYIGSAGGRGSNGETPRKEMLGTFGIGAAFTLGMSVYSF